MYIELSVGRGQRKNCYFLRLNVRLGPDLQNILPQSYDYLTIMPQLRSTYDECLIYKTAYNEWKAFHGYDTREKS